MSAHAIVSGCGGRGAFAGYPDVECSCGNAILPVMAAKNKFKGLGGTAISRADADLQDLQDLLGLHFQACRRAEELEEQIQELQAAGKYPEARVLRMHSLGIQQGLRAIEAEVRMVVRPGKQRSAATVAAKQTAASSPSLGTDLEAAMDARIPFEVTR
jgi:hypothetical protein